MTSHHQPYNLNQGFWQTMRLNLIFALIYYSREVLLAYDVENELEPK